MKWFKHDSDAHSDAKLKRVRIKYGLEGYGLYWYCLELIAKDVSETKLTFELEHDSEIIAHDTGIHYERVQEMMTYMVELNLFENETGVLTCLKMAKRLDQSMTSNPKMRKLISKAKENHDSIMTESRLNHDTVMQDKNRLDKNRLDKSKGGKPPKNTYKKINLENIPGELTGLLKEFIDHRVNKKSPLTQNAFNRFLDAVQRTSEELSISPERVITETIDAGWKSVKPDWLRNRLGVNHGNKPINQSSDRPRSPADRFRAIRKSEQRSNGSPVGEDAGELRPSVGGGLRDNPDRGLVVGTVGHQSTDDQARVRENGDNQ